MITADDVAEFLIGRPPGEPELVRLYWCHVESSRKTFESKLLDRAGGLTQLLLPVKVRANELSVENFEDDVVRLLEANRDQLLARWSEREHRAIAVVLLSRSACALPQISSPASLPEWMPCGGGKQYQMRLEDLATAMRSPLSDEHIRAVASGLWDLERTVLLRLRQSSVATGVLEAAAVKLGLDELDTNLLRVADREAYRPSARHPETLFGYVWRTLSVSHDPKVHKVLANALGQALGRDARPAHPWRYPLPLVFVGSVPDMASSVERVGWWLIHSVCACCRLFNAVAHRDRVPVAAPVALGRLLFMEIARGLGELRTIIRSHSDQNGGI